MSLVEQCMDQWIEINFIKYIPYVQIIIALSWAFLWAWDFIFDFFSIALVTTFSFYCFQYFLLDLRKSSKILAKVPSWILRKRRIEHKSTSNDLVTMLSWYWSELCFVWNGWFSSHFIATTIPAPRCLFRTMRGKKKKYVVYTYCLIVLIKLDFPAPAMPVIAMFTSTSFHLSIFLLKKFAMARRPFVSISVWKSCIYFDSQFIAIGRLKTDGYKACYEGGPQQRQSLISVAYVSSETHNLQLVFRPGVYSLI